MRQAQADSPLRRIPLVVLSHRKPFALPDGFPPEFAPILERAWRTMQNQLARLVPGSEHIVATHSGHYIQLDQPGLVRAAIKRVVKAVRASSGYGYLTTRDGTKLAIYVHPPQDVANALPLPGGVKLPQVGNGPYPTLIEYAGYGYADPAGPQSGIAILANLMGFAVVDVNMRGTGCSGGAYDFFEPLQNLDGCDVIESIARPPWVLHHTGGMMGISYRG